MNIAVIGAGYVGLVTGACFAEGSDDVTFVDKDVSKIEKLKKGNLPIFEPGLKELVDKGVRQNHINFTTDIGQAVKDSNIVFITVGTPPKDGKLDVDISHVLEAAEDVAKNLTGHTTIIVKSTVPPGTCDKVEETLKQFKPQHATFDVVSNPEFLGEGTAIADFKKPDRVVCGVESDRAKETMTSLYCDLPKGTPIVFSDRHTAELTKYAANAFLATKISFMNGIAELCEKIGADIDGVAKGIGYDTRIGNKFLRAGAGYGGSCLPKDANQLIAIGEKVGVPQKIVKSAVETNDRTRERLVDIVQQGVEDGDLRGKEIAVLGLTHKPNTDDMRDSPSAILIPELLARGAKLRLHDPEAIDNAKPLFTQDGIVWSASKEEAMRGADAAVLLTEWPEYKQMDLGTIKTLLASPTPSLVDLRNVFNRKEMHSEGFRYISVGRPPVGGAISSVRDTEDARAHAVASSVREVEVVCV